ncbi:hypothetical protein HAX54_047960, partial [Datura stramonium]|nr:hypothetical protein [Datura stramonium]
MRKDGSSFASSIKFCFCSSAIYPLIGGSYLEDGPSLSSSLSSENYLSNDPSFS